MGVKTKLVWNGPKVFSEIEDTMVNRLDLALMTLKNEARQLISRVQPVVGTGTRKRGTAPSLPNTPPKRVRGFLHSSIFSEIDRQKVRGRVGTPLKYGLFQEIGTKNIAPRPWMSVAMKNKRQRIKSILTRPIKGGD